MAVMGFDNSVEAALSEPHSQCHNGRRSYIKTRSPCFSCLTEILQFSAILMSPHLLSNLQSHQLWQHIKISSLR